jgi:hypothetical protein
MQGRHIGTFSEITWRAGVSGATVPRNAVRESAYATTARRWGPMTAVLWHARSPFLPRVPAGLL